MRDQCGKNKLPKECEIEYDSQSDKWEIRIRGLMGRQSKGENMERDS